MLYELAGKHTCPKDKSIGDKLSIAGPRRKGERTLIKPRPDCAGHDPEQAVGLRQVCKVLHHACAGVVEGQALRSSSRCELQAWSSTTEPARATVCKTPMLPTDATGPEAAVTAATASARTSVRCSKEAMLSSRGVPSLHLHASTSQKQQEGRQQRNEASQHTHLGEVQGGQALQHRVPRAALAGVHRPEAA